MKIETLVLSPYQSNCYIVESNNEAIVIDAAEPNSELLERLKQLNVKYIVSTHAHPDHINGNAFLKENLNVPIIIPERDYEMYKAVSETELGENDIFINEGDLIQFGGTSLELIYTPGHSPGHSILMERDERIIFIGDLIFAGSIGRTDFPGCSPSDMRESLTRVINFEGDWTLYPGHGPVTTLDRERETNPFLADLQSI